MRKFDEDEQIIYNEFSKMTVDSGKLTEKVKHQLDEDVFDVKQHPGIKWSKTAIVVFVMSTMLLLTVAGATLGGFDWFRQTINPLFGDFVQPVGQYSEDQGIRMEVIGAEQYEDTVIIYLSFQDISGQNRLTEQSTLLDAIDIGLKSRFFLFPKQSIEVSGFSYKENFLGFDEDTNTIYYEYIIIADEDSTIRNPLQIDTSLIYFDIEEYLDEPLAISLVEVELGKTMDLEEGQILSQSNKGEISQEEIDAIMNGDVDEDWDSSEDFETITEALIPGYYADLPHGRKDQWISNIGIVNGKLHVQTVSNFEVESGVMPTTLSLKSPEGNVHDTEYEFNFRIHEKDIPEESKKHFDPLYRYDEYVFSVDVEELNQYTLNFSGTEYSRIEGDWRVIANLEDQSENRITIKEDIVIQGYVFEQITLSPLGVNGKGTFEENAQWKVFSEMALSIETEDGIIPLNSAGGSRDDLNNKFSVRWEVKTPLNVDTIRAIIIDDIRIQIKKGN